MSDLENLAGLTLAQQADIIRNTCTLVAERKTEKFTMELYALEWLFLEVSYRKDPAWCSVIKISYTTDTTDLQPYLQKITLPSKINVR